MNKSLDLQRSGAINFIPLEASPFLSHITDSIKGLIKKISFYFKEEKEATFGEKIEILSQFLSKEDIELIDVNFRFAIAKTPMNILETLSLANVKEEKKLDFLKEIISSLPLYSLNSEKKTHISLEMREKIQSLLNQFLLSDSDKIQEKLFMQLEGRGNSYF